MSNDDDDFQGGKKSLLFGVPLYLAQFSSTDDPIGETGIERRLVERCPSRRSQVVRSVLVMLSMVPPQPMVCSCLTVTETKNTPNTGGTYRPNECDNDDTKYSSSVGGRAEHVIVNGLQLLRQHAELYSSSSSSSVTTTTNSSANILQTAVAIGLFCTSYKRRDV